MLTTCDKYTKQKGFCEDLDEGKYSLPLIHALGHCKQLPNLRSHGTVVLRNLLAQRHVTGRMTMEQKKLFLQHIEAQGSLDYTRQAMQELQVELKSLAEQMGMLRNEQLKNLMETLKV